MTTFHVLYQGLTTHPGKIVSKEWVLTEHNGQARLLEGLERAFDTYAQAELSLPVTAVIVPPAPSDYANVTTYVVP